MSNTFASQLLEKIDERFSIDSLNMSYSDWICKNTTLRSRPFSLEDYEFQRQIVDDMHPNLSCIKISQVGLTEIQIRKALAFLVRNNGTSVIFSLPDEDMYKKISAGRIKPIVDKDKVFNTPFDKEMGVTRSMEMKQFGQSFLYIVAAIEKAATSISADMVLNDEVDLSDQSMIALFNSRLQGSKYKISQRFSTPSFPGFGVDADWQTSDQHHYKMRCQCCGKWCYPEFTDEFVHLHGRPDLPLTEITEEMQDDLNFELSYIKCNHCGKQLDLGNPENRQWVSKYPNRTHSRGYAINPFVTANLDLSYIYTSMWRFYKRENKRGFFNTVLGQPYTDGSIQIPEEAIRACMEGQPSTKPDLKGLTGIWVGIDVGQTCHFVIGDARQNIIAMYQMHVDKLVEHVEELCANNIVYGGAIDRHPYEPTADAVFKVSKGKIIPTEYRGQKETNAVIDAYGEVSHAQTNRTWMLDQFSGKVKRREITISGFGHYKEVFIAHLRNMVRNEEPEKEAEWIKLNPDDHFFHAGAFMNVAPDLHNMVEIKQKTEVRTMALGQIFDITGKQASGLIGMSGKVDHSKKTR